MELKVLCDCGQKYSFDVEPVGGRMPVRVNCPSCGADGTDHANNLLTPVTPSVPAAPAAIPPVPSPGSGLRINKPVAPPLPTAPPVLAAVAPPPLPVARPGAPMRSAVPAAKPVKASGEFNLGLGILGALVGAGLSSGLMFGLSEAVGFRFPLLGTCIGGLTGLGARILYKGTDSTLGMVSGLVALLATGTTLFFLFGEFSVSFAISMAVSVYFAYRVAS